MNFKVLATMFALALCAPGTAAALTGDRHEMLSCYTDDYSIEFSVEFVREESKWKSYYVDFSVGEYQSYFWFNQYIEPGTRNPSDSPSSTSSLQESGGDVWNSQSEGPLTFVIEGEKWETPGIMKILDFKMIAGSLRNSREVEQFKTGDISAIVSFTNPKEPENEDAAVRGIEVTCGYYEGPK